MPDAGGAGCSIATYILLDDDRLELSTSRLNQFVVGNRLAAQEDVEHEGNALKAQHVITATVSIYVCVSREILDAYRLAGISILS